MNIKLILNFLSKISCICAGAMIPSLVLSYYYAEKKTPQLYDPSVSFIICIIICTALSIILHLAARSPGKDKLSAADGFAATVFGWLTAAALGALPYYLICFHNGGFGYTEAFFESISGFTTTGSSVFGTAIADGGYGTIESLPKSLLFWRSLTHWLGGMGIVVLALAVLPALRAGGYKLFLAEVPGPEADRLQPRIRETAAILWGAYSILTIMEAVLLWLGGMEIFDAICHTFATMATGGFSTKDASIGHYLQPGNTNGLYLEMIINLFMFLAGCNFLLHYQAMRGRLSEYWRNTEFRFYSYVVLITTTIFTLLVYFGNTYPSLWQSFCESLFQTLSIMTTTGFATTDTNIWPNAARLLLILIMFFGGCAGSTGGGMKQIRIMVAWKYGVRELKKMLRPNMVNRIRIGEETTLEEKAAMGIIGLLVLWVGTFALASLALILMLPANGNGVDCGLVTAVSAVAACLNNIGPGLGAVGSTANFHWMPESAKWVLSFCMLIGRLEIYTVFVLILPMAWRR